MCKYYVNMGQVQEALDVHNKVYILASRGLCSIAFVEQTLHHFVFVTAYEAYQPDAGDEVRSELHVGALPAHVHDTSKLL